MKEEVKIEVKEPTSIHVTTEYEVYVDDINGSDVVTASSLIEARRVAEDWAKKTRKTVCVDKVKTQRVLEVIGGTFE